MLQQPQEMRGVLYFIKAIRNSQLYRRADEGLYLLVLGA